MRDTGVSGSKVTEYTSPLASNTVKVCVSLQVKSYSATVERALVSDCDWKFVSDANAVAERLLFMIAKVKSDARNNFVFDFIKKIIDKDIVA